MDFFHTHISDKSKQLVQEVLDSGFINQGPMVEKLEEELESFGLVNPITINSCTSALHVALMCCDVAGKEVILPAQTFISTGLAVLMAGGIPVFTDIHYDGNINISEIEANITKNTATIIVVHWGGKPCEILEINELAQRNNIPVIEDAAHAFGATDNGKLIGTISDFTCFSFQAIKFLTCGDGGAICVRDEKNISKIRKLKWFGIDKNKIKRNVEGDRDIDVDILGYKYNMNDISAAIALGNLETVPKRLQIRRSIAIRYDEAMGFGRPNNYEASYWLYQLNAINRPKFIDFMNRRNIPVSVVDRRIDTNSVFNQDNYLPQQYWFDNHQISMPIHEGLSTLDVDTIVQALEDYKD